MKIHGKLITICWGFLSISLLFLGNCTHMSENKKETKTTAGHQNSQPQLKSEVTTEQNIPCSIRLIEYKLLYALKGCARISRTTPLLSVRISITFAFNNSSQFVLPFDKIKLSGSNGQFFALQYLGGFNEKIDEFSLLRLDTLAASKEITNRIRSINNTEECSNFIYFPTKEGKTAFLLFDGSMCDKSTQTIHMGFDVNESSGPYSLSFARSNIIEIPKQ